MPPLKGLHFSASRWMVVRSNNPLPTVTIGPRLQAEDQPLTEPTVKPEMKRSTNRL